MKVKEYREKWGLTQKDMAKASGIGVNTLRNIENQKISMSNIKVETAVRLARTMGISLDEFVGPIFEHDEKLIFERDIKWMK